MQDWIKLYQQGHSLAKIAKQYNTYPLKIQRVLKKAGIVRRTTSQAATTLPTQHIIQEYENGVSARNIAFRLNSTVTSVTDLLKRHQVQMRINKSKADWSFIYDDRPLFMYWLGWILSDGHITYKRAGGRNRGVVVGLTVETKDKHIVEFFRNKINPEATIINRENARVLQVSIPREDAIYLSRWALIQNKSLVLAPTDLLWSLSDRDFHQMLVGYIEGDGYIGKTGCGNICCGSRVWLEYIANKVPWLGNIYPHNGSHRLRFGAKAAARLWTTWEELHIHYHLLDRKWSRISRVPSCG